ncbi:MAG: hemolysin family protein [Eubacteriales bacterium]|nr:hemolysin family protein [Eubacteriales bacterium]
MSSGPSGLKALFNWRKKDDTVEEIRSIIEEGHEQGAIEPDEAEMISNVFEFGDKEVRDVMNPRQKIIGIEANTDVKDALNVMLENSFSRYPIYEEDVDNIIGVLHIKEAVVAYLDNADQVVRELGSKPYCIHPTQKISKLFNDMRENKVHLAIVVDEYGQTEGVVAMEDMLEVIVGDILDEHDEEEEDILKIAIGEGYIVKGSTELEELEDLFHIEFPDEDIDTVNGFMLYQLGRLPRENETIKITYQGFIFEAMEREDYMIKKVRIRKDENEMESFSYEE